MPRWLIWLLMLGLMSVLIHIARSEPPENANPALSAWFNSLTNPQTGGISCCAQADGHILNERQWRVDGDHYMIKIAGNWYDVPPEAVLQHVENPTGGAVAFYPPAMDEGAGMGRNPTIYCFVRQVEG